MISCFLAIGTNLGELEKNLLQAIEELRHMKHSKVLRTSSFMSNKAYGVEDQPDFLNGVVEIETELGERELLDAIKAIERKIGRQKTFRWGPRRIDIDIIFYGDEIYKDDVLEIPHKDLIHRDFVLQPMMELAPEKIHPVFHKTIRELFSELNNR